MSPFIATGRSRKRSRVAKTSGRKLGPISSTSFKEGLSPSLEDASKTILLLIFPRRSLLTTWLGRENPPVRSSEFGASSTCCFATWSIICSSYIARKASSWCSLFWRLGSLLSALLRFGDSPQMFFFGRRTSLHPSSRSRGIPAVFVILPAPVEFLREA